MKIKCDEKTFEADLNGGDDVTRVALLTSCAQQSVSLAIKEVCKNTNMSEDEALLAVLNAIISGFAIDENSTEDDMYRHATKSVKATLNGVLLSTDPIASEHKN